MQNSNDYWITTKELAQIKGISERAVRKAISKINMLSENVQNLTRF